ncbi:MAG: response regulator [Deltaproteobacteria bacterium]|nr:response regulator [Deltaproteobacteria bacterium]
MKVLLIEDEPLVLQEMTELFESAGHDVIGCSFAVSALGIAVNEAVDLICVDLNLPDMDGLKIVQFVRLQAADLPIFVVSGRVQEGLEKQCIDVGASLVFEKPLDESAFMREVSRVAENRLSMKVAFIEGAALEGSGLELALQRQGCDVVAISEEDAFSVKEGVKLLETLKQVSVFLVDDSARGADKWLHWASQTRRPVIVLRSSTSRNTAQREEGMMREGAAMVMQHPLDERRLMNQLSFLCQ